MSEQIVEGIKYLVEKAKYFQKLKKSEDFLFQEINKIDTKVLIDIQEQYKNEEKIKKIRYETAKFLQNDTLNSEVFEKLKQGINAKYNTNIIKSWKNYSILYVLFFNEIKQNVDNILQEITHYFIEQSGEQLKFKISNFDGAQNFGETGCWLAIYNSKYKSQSEGTQYFINFYSENLNYGTYKHSSREYIQKQNYTYDDIGQVLVNEIADDIKRQKSLVLETENHTNGEEHMQETQPINQILYGPPGTGKTYNTINRALEIVFEKEDKIFEIFEIVGKESEYKKTYSDALQENDRESLKAIFDCYKERGQIEFVTFHQSYGYEEFVEGIKASTLDNEVKYSVESGIFKKLSKIAKENYEDSKKSITQIKEEQSLKQKLRDFLSDSLDDETIFKKTKGGEFKIKDLKENSILLFSKDSNYNENLLELDIDELYKILESTIDIKTSRQIAKEIFDIPNQRQRDTYYFAIYKAFKEFDKTHKETNTIEIPQQALQKNHIIIIDEINRGNISKIFGELITLIEPSKRIGEDEEILLKLPNSSEPFGVPSNLYIIGTMNTADRSIAQIDTALRRRFEFVEMMPQHDLLKNSENMPLIIMEDNKRIEVQKILEAINERIEYIYDREHTIGHSYFMPLIKEPTKTKLDEIFRVNIIPLLAEYFYSDWDDIKIILNDTKDEGEFIRRKQNSKYFINESKKNNKVYSVKQEEFAPEAYINIYNGLTQES